MHSSNPELSPAMAPSEFDNSSDTKIPSPLCPSPSSSADRLIITTSNSNMHSTSYDSSSSPLASSASSCTSSNPTSHGSGSDVLVLDNSKNLSTTTPLTSIQANTFNFQSNNNVGSESLQRPVSPFHAPCQLPPPLCQQSSRSLLSQPQPVATAMQNFLIPSHDSTTSYLPPDPPVILLSTENSTIMTQSSFQSQAPYFPFLSHAPSLENSWIEVETLQNEYKLQVCLPGFTQDGITLVTKRRRILHVIADKWEDGGGK